MIEPRVATGEPYRFKPMATAGDVSWSDWTQPRSGPSQQSTSMGCGCRSPPEGKYPGVALSWQLWTHPAAGLDSCHPAPRRVPGRNCWPGRRRRGETCQALGWITYKPSPTRWAVRTAWESGWKPSARCTPRRESPA